MQATANDPAISVVKERNLRADFLIIGGTSGGRKRERGTLTAREGYWFQSITQKKPPRTVSIANPVSRAAVGKKAPSAI